MMRNQTKHTLRKALAGGIVLLGLTTCSSAAQKSTIDWKETKGDHFIVYTTDNGSDGRDILRACEKSLKETTKALGYSKFGNFWSWDNRVNVYVYPDKESYVLHTRQPAWSAGAAIYKGVNKEKKIVTFEMGGRLADSLLPHEIAHMVLCDFVGKKNAPLWLQEGVAQMQERTWRSRLSLAQRTLRKHSEENIFTLNDLRADSLRSIDAEHTYRDSFLNADDETGDVWMFYARSLSLVDFLANEMDDDDFTTFCKKVRDGEDVNEALRYAYGSSTDELVGQWKEHVLGKQG